MQSQTIFNNLKSSDSPFVACREKLLRFSITLVPYSLLQEFEENDEAFKSIIERAWKQDIQFDARQLFTGDNTNRVKALVFGYQRTNFHMPVYFFFLAAIQNIFRSNSGLCYIIKVFKVDAVICSHLKMLIQWYLWRNLRIPSQSSDHSSCQKLNSCLRHTTICMWRGSVSTLKCSIC